MNAMCESFFATLECELLARRRFKNHAEARMAHRRLLQSPPPAFLDRLSLAVKRHPELPPLRHEELPPQVHDRG